MPAIQRWHLRFRLFLRGRKYRRILVSSLVFSICLFVFSALTALSVFDRQHNNIVYHYVQRQDDIALLSATFYNTSKSFSNNSLVLLFVAHQIFHYKHSSFEIETFAGNETTRATLRIMPVIGQMPFYCKWVPFIAIGELDITSSAGVRLISGEKQIELNLREPYPEKHPVVACFSPLFLNERWQLLILTAQVYSHYGAFMHFYVRSMITDLFDVLKYYKHSRVVPWSGIHLGKESASGPGFRPDFELEFRNQAGAMTDCLLMYKESASYIIFPDTDDIIIPRLGKNFEQEFSQIFALFPEAAVIAYNMSQTDIHAEISPSNYMVDEVLTSVRFRGETRWGKVVVRPERIDSVWIHKSYGIRDGYEQITLPIELNSALHLRFWNFSETGSLESKIDIPLYDPLLTKNSNQTPKYRSPQRPLMSNDDLQEIRKSFQEMTRTLGEIYLRLPEFSIYYPLIEKCYDRIFYNGQRHATCKGPEMCDLPSFPGVRCVNVNSSVDSFRGDNIFIHLQKNWFFEHSTNGCSI
ncbi:unnamed protein product, partial [Mesorhabditis belari]|uniref:Glycosyltransferase family 92 protein n=1 Tax=Mesorhabditis belari TaxID=2138241 RepID=A0AAF3ET76_9BILA